MARFSRREIVGGVVTGTIAAGAGTAQAGFEILLQETDCLLCGGIPSYPVTLGGAYG